MTIYGEYYKPIITKGSFNNNYTQYESRGEKDKILTIKKYLDKIKPYLNDMINDHKTQGTLRIHYPGNKIIEHKLTMAINFHSSKPDPDETCIMREKSGNIEIMIGSDIYEIMIWYLFVKDTKKD